MLRYGLLTSVLVACVAGRAAAADIPRVAPEDFAILPWGGTPAEPEILAGIHECGFNLAGFVAPEGLDAVHAAKLKAIVSWGPMHVGDAEAELAQAEIDKRVAEIAGKVAGHPGVYGYYLRDEPGAHMFPALGRWVAALAKADPKHRAYVNLFPNYANAAQMRVPTYDEYIEQFAATVKPPFISYDNYSLINDGSLRDGYFQNLEAAWATALRHKVPFWNIVLGNAHFAYAEPSDGGFAFQLYTTLAYGARGISYFTYFTPALGNYRLAPLDQFNHRTPTWDMLRRANLQVHRLAPTYLKLTSTGVFHHPEVPVGSKALKDSRLVADLGGGNFVVGEFDGPGGKPYVLVVNKDRKASVVVGIRLKQAGRIMVTSPWTGGEQPWEGEQVWLAPGQGHLLHVE